MGGGVGGVRLQQSADKFQAITVAYIFVFVLFCWPSPTILHTKKTSRLYINKVCPDPALKKIKMHCTASADNIIFVTSSRLRLFGRRN